MNGPALLLLSGLPGTGKSTFARLLAAHTGACHVESDAVRLALFPTRRYSRSESARVFDEVERRCSVELDRGGTVIVDATNLTRADRRRFIILAAARQARLVSIRLVAPAPLARARLSKPRQGASQATAAVYDLMASRPQSFRGPVVVVDSRYPIEASLALAVALLG